MQVSFLCSCGGSARATSRPPGDAISIVDTVRKLCLDQGHHEVDAAEFKRIRARQRREEARGL